MAWERLGQIIRALHPLQAFDLACHIVRTVPGAYRPTFVGGALAHLVHYHGEALIDWIEREARRDVDFLAALSNAWVNGGGVHPTILIRLRVATRARIHIARPREHDSIYKGMFERWMTEHPPLRAPDRTHPPHARGLAPDAASEPPSLSDHPPAQSPMATDPAQEASPGTKSPWWMRHLVYFVRLQLRILFMPRLVQHMAYGPLLVWFQWYCFTTVSDRLLLPVLVVVLAMLSASPVADLVLFALAFVAATVVTALAGLVIGVVGERRRQSVSAVVYVALVMPLIPYVIGIALIARAEHGAIAAAAVVTGIVSRRLLRRLFRGARAVLRHAPATGSRGATPRIYRSAQT